MRENMRHAQFHAKGGLANALTQNFASTQNSTHAKSGLAKCVKTCVCVKFLREIEFKKFWKLLRGVLRRLIFLSYLGLFWRDNFTPGVFGGGESDGIFHFVIYDMYKALLPRWYQDCQDVVFSFNFWDKTLSW